MNLLRCFSEHPASVGETYTRHCLQACTFAGRLLAASLACLVHAFLPFLFVRTASESISKLHASLSARNHMLRARTEPLHPGKTQRLPQ
jgi:hypothetical protein